MTISKDEVAQVAGVPVEKLDFSQWHPLDHHWWSPICPTFHGGRRNHFELWYDYQRPRPIQTVKCWLGRHEWVEFWRGKANPASVPDGLMCNHCMLDAK